MQMTVLVGTKVKIEASASHQIRIVSYLSLRQVSAYVLASDIIHSIWFTPIASSRWKSSRISLSLKGEYVNFR